MGYEKADPAPRLRRRSYEFDFIGRIPWQRFAGFIKLLHIALPALFALGVIFGAVGGGVADHERPSHTAFAHNHYAYMMIRNLLILLPALAFIAAKWLPPLKYRREIKNGGVICSRRSEFMYRAVPAVLAVFTAAALAAVALCIEGLVRSGVKWSELSIYEMRAAYRSGLLSGNYPFSDIALRIWLFALTPFVLVARTDCVVIFADTYYISGIYTVEYKHITQIRAAGNPRESGRVKIELFCGGQLIGHKRAALSRMGYDTMEMSEVNKLQSMLNNYPPETEDT